MIQAAIDAALAYTNADPNQGLHASVDVSGTWSQQSPIYIDGHDLVLTGLGDLRGINYYGGPNIVIGIPRLSQTVASAHRPLSLFTGRRALATLGTHIFAVTADPLQLGPLISNLVSDSWQGKAYTIEALLVRPPGVSWPVGSANVLFGSVVGNTPNPIQVLALGGGLGFKILFRTNDQDQNTWHDYSATSTDPGPTFGLTLQWDFDKGILSVWINGSPCVPFQFTPGLRLAKPNGTDPWTFGGPGFAEPRFITNVELHGYTLNAKLKYVPGTTLLESQYFDESSAAYLPLNDTPATHAVIRIPSAGNSVGFWIAGDHTGESVAARISIHGLSTRTAIGASVLIGNGYELNMADCNFGLGALQGVGTLSYMCFYPIRLLNCKLAGTDAAYVGSQQIMLARDCKISGIGRHAVRFAGGNSTWENVIITDVQPITESFFRYLSNAYGFNHILRDVLIDNENGTPSIALIECDQPRYIRGSLKIDGFIAATLQIPAVGIWLRGFGIGGDWKSCVLHASGITQWGGSSVTILRTDGQGWTGKFDTSELDVKTIVGDGQFLIE